MSAWSIGCRFITSGSKPCSTTCRAPGSRSTIRRTRFAATASTRSPTSTAPGAMSRPPRAPAPRSIVRCVPSGFISTKRNGERRCTGDRSSRSRPSPRPKPIATNSTPAPARCAISPPSAPTRRWRCSRRCATTSKPSANPAIRPQSPPSARARPSASSACCASVESPICAASPTAARSRHCRGRRSGSRYCRSNRASRPTRWSFSASRTSSATGWRGLRGGGATSTSSSPRRPTSRPAISSSTPTTASAGTRRSRPSMSPARRMIACACSMPATTGCLSRSRTSRCCRVSAPKRPGRSSTGLVGWPGSRARRGSSSASAISPAS